MNDLEPYVVEMPAPPAGDDLWRIEFVGPIEGRLRLIWADNVTKRMAQFVMRFWMDREPGRIIFCRVCPVGERVPCPHEDTPGQRGWRSHEMSNVRIMPMREAV